MDDNTQTDTTHVLILRLWREPRQGVDTAPEWRALIEDVASRQRFPIRDMSYLQTLLAPYGDELGLDDFF